MANGAVENKSTAVHKKVDDVKLYINGQFKEAASGRSFENVNPFTNEVINSVAEGDKTEIDEAVSAADKAFKEGPWGSMKLAERMKYIDRIADLIDEEVEEIAVLESLDTGLPIKQTRKMTARAAENFRFYSRMVQTKLHGEAYQVDDEFINYTVYKPLGVVGLITPWNAPFMLETWKVAPALATGNTVVLKPAELSPLTANKLAEIIDKAELPEGVFNVVHGFGETAGASLVAHPDVKAISFTGETVTGSTIIKNAADTLKKTSMELGGKSPLIVFEDADLDRALDAAVWGIFSFNGERCTANSRLLLHKNVKDEFVEKLKKRVENIKIGDPMDTSTQLGPLIEKNHFEKVKKYIDIAREEGCEVVQGTVPEEMKAGNFVPPTLLLNATNEMTVSQEEIFGPVMAVIEFETEEEAVAMANDVKYGLAGYVWTNDIKRGHRVAQAVDAGMLWVNSQNVRDLRIPFGGMKDSGIGREGGHFAIFEFYTEPKVIHVAISDHHIPQFGK
ncbi:5-carboxymethyl-2-hydroxymuconate semialdehyde dehydrogenase [Evansella sp. LMS18]|jgi:5-carboxymethyl-2-hydroxymuconic-semialdehyde dehydrogenase|uniref:5-carboxymethyl-2-hydroxymuconate semialdehyde dehydrogenase n=1 Tax=Evansella sp. LMS18 TaxID=2924033 RepID=UPI0020D13348|nr:5-carboxymethyl-2-hydroxymuconate semialdehyde dehydrogenase [Evansella sp. LMS18]UTR11872.1 5-carboxymethyl-2-hydroxymuconate semialdehyde dehydrogenase [Evansella sp. LMS18]